MDINVPTEAGKYVSLQLLTSPGGSVSIQSFKINNVEQLTTIPYTQTAQTVVPPQLLQGQFPFTTYADSNAFNWFPNPYLNNDTGYEVTIVTNTVSGTTFEAISYPGSVYSNDSYALVNDPPSDSPLPSNTSITYTVPAETGRYVSLQLHTIPGGSFSIQSFKINNVEQLTTIPYIH
jgi:hypothetical protein